jgi:hypothetical protein
MSLMGYFIVGVAIRINGPIQLLKSHQCSDKLVIGVEKGSKPLF